MLGVDRLVRICLLDKLAWRLGRSRCGSTSRLVLLNNRGLNGCGRTGAAVVDDDGSVTGSVLGSEKNFCKQLFKIIYLLYSKCKNCSIRFQSPILPVSGSDVGSLTGCTLVPI